MFFNRHKQQNKLDILPVNGFVTTKKTANRATGFAEYVIANYGGGVGTPAPPDPNLARECENLKEECRRINGAKFSERIYLLTIAGDRLVPNTPYEMDLKLKCYVYAGATCRKRVINYAPDYLNGPEIWADEHEDPCIHKEMMMLYLAKSYEGEKIFQHALELFEELFKQNPSSEYYATSIVRVLNSMGLFDVSLQFIEDQRHSKVYNMSGREYRRFLELEDRRRLINQCKRQGLDADATKMLSKPIGPRAVPNNFFRIELDRAALATGAAIARKRERNDYEWIARNLPEICPKSYSGYRRMKSQNTKNFIKLAKACLQAGRNIQIEDEFTEQDREWSELLKAERPIYCST